MYTDEFTDLMGYGSHLRYFTMDMLDLEVVVSDEINGCGFED